jgi:hypothetical protein
VGSLGFSFKYKYIVGYTETAKQSFDITVKDGKCRIQIFNTAWYTDNFNKTYEKVKKYGKSGLPLQYKEIEAYNEVINTIIKNFVNEMQTAKKDDFKKPFTLAGDSTP